MGGSSKPTHAEPSFFADPAIKQGLIASLAAHACVLLALGARLVLYPPEPMQIERAIRVDIVGLPSFAKPALEEPAPPAPKAPAPPAATKEKPPPEPSKAGPSAADINKFSLNTAKKSQAGAIKRLEAFKKLEAMSKAQPAAEAKPAAAPIRGNQVVAGNSLTGVAKIDYDGYLEGLDAQVKKHWALPEWLANANLKAQVVVWLDARGNVVKKKMVSSSNNPVFDQRVMEAIDKASPFPPPPARLADIFAVDGVKLGFPE
jgi:TonB family protein